MTDATLQDLGRGKIQRLLAAVGSTPAGATEAPEAIVYDWRDPHYYGDDQRNRLAAMMSQVGALLAEQFAHFYGSEFDVTPSSIVEFFAGDLANHIRRADMFSLPFSSDGNQPNGYLAVDVETALDWGTRLLGDADSEGDSDRQLSSLEQSLLTDLAGALGRAFLDGLRGHLNLKAGVEIVKGCPDLSLESTQEICKIAFQVKRADSEDASEAVFVFPCRTLASLVGKEVQATLKQPQEELTRLLMGHIQQIPVTVTARLATTRLSFEEVLNLAPDDILLMDKSIDEFVDVIVENEVVFHGRPAQSGGQYAVYVTECVNESGHGTGKNSGTN